MKQITSLVAALLLFSSLGTSHAATSHSQHPIMPIRENPGSLPILINLDDVGRDLQLTSLQKSGVAELRSDYRAAAIKLMRVHHQNRAELAQAQQKLEKLSFDYNRRTMDLLTSLQQHRLREIERQILGGTLLIAPSEQKLLGLSEEQRQKIEKIHQDYYKRAIDIDLRADKGKLNYHQQILALRKNRKQHGIAMVKVLTPEQQKVWERSQGKKLLFHH
jgi:Spy/CpxP family protein refolding chaperone